MKWIRKQCKEFIERCKEFIDLFKGHPLLTILGVLLTLGCIAGYLFQARPWGVLPPWTEFGKESLFAFGVEFIIIWVTVVVVYFVLEGRKKRERDPVYRAVFKDAHVVYQKMFEWLFVIMREEFANDERNARRENRTFPRIDETYRAKNAECSWDFSAKKVVGQFFKEYENKSIFVSRYNYEKRLYDIEKDVEHFLQCHAAFLVSDVTEEEGSELIRHFSDLRFFLRNLQRIPGYGENEVTDEIELTFLKGERSEREEKDEAFFVRVKIEKRSEEVLLSFLKTENNDEDDVWDAQLTALRKFYDKVLDMKHIENYYSETQLKCQTISALVDVLAQEGGQGSAAASEAESDDSVRREGIQSRYPETLKCVHELFAKCQFRIAQYNLGIIIFEFGKTEMEEKTAVDTFKALAKDKNICDEDKENCNRIRAGACFHLGLMYRHGRGLGAKDPMEAKKWFEKAACQGHKDAQFVLGLIFRDGLGVRRDLKKTEEWFKKASSEGNGTSESREWSVAEREPEAVYWNGRGERERLLSEREWYGTTVERGHLEAQYQLGLSWLPEGWRTMQNVDKVVPYYDFGAEWFREAAEKGHVEAKYHLGLVCLEGRGTGQRIDEAKAVKLFREAAEKGHVEAKFHLGIVCLEGRGAEQRIDEAKAVKLFREAAEKGHVEGKYHLGLACLEGRGAEQRIDETKAVKLFREAAEEGHVEAKYHLGLVCLEGRGAEQRIDEAKAVEWFRGAAEEGHIEAQYHLGLAYRDGRGVPNDDEAVWLAAKWFRKAAKGGHARARSCLGDKYRDGDGVAKHIYESVEWFPKDADQVDADVAKRLLGVAIRGHADAQFVLGRSCLKNLGTEQEIDEAEAVRWFREAAEQGHAGAEYHLGLAYRDGCGVTKNDDEAKNWLQEAAEQGNREARNDFPQATEQASASEQYRRGCDCLKGRAWRRTDDDDDEPVKWFRKAARQGHADARERLGNMWLHDLSMEQGGADVVRYALTSLRRRAGSGDLEAANCLGRLYREGRGVDLDYFEALAWFRRTANQDHADGQFQLGKMYRDGLGVPRNYCQAVEWFRKAAEQGDADAECALGVAYRDGCGVEEKDPEEAVGWFFRAAEKGYVPAYFELKRMRRKHRASAARAQEDEKAVKAPMEDALKRAVEVLSSEERSDPSYNAEAAFALGVAYRDRCGAEEDGAKATEKFRSAARGGHAWAYRELTKLSPADPVDWQNHNKDLKWAVEKFRRRFERSHDAEAAFALGIAYRDGCGVEKNGAEAENWFRKAAEQGNARVHCELGKLHLECSVGGKDVAKALQQFRLSAKGGCHDALEEIETLAADEECGSSAAQVVLGRMYLKGLGVPTEYGKAAYWFRRAAVQGDADGRFQLGQMYGAGCGVEEDSAEAAKLFREVAGKGHAGAYHELARMHRAAIKVAQEYSGRPESAPERPEFIETLNEAVKCFRQRAEESGDGEAALALGIAYRDGSGVERKDSGEALKWLREAALRGRARAYCELMKMKRDFVHLVEEIDDALKDVVKCFRWRAEESGDGEAALALGFAYRDGCGVEKRDPEEAEKWFRKAAQRGHAPAYRELGRRYGEGTGEEKDIARAAEYFQWAVQRGDTQSYFKLVQMLQRLEDMSRKSAPKGNEVEEVDYDPIVLVNEALKRAVECLQRQVEVRRDVEVEFALGRAYSEGCGVERDQVQARKWLEKAAQRGDTGAQEDLDSLEFESCFIAELDDADLNEDDEIPVLPQEAYELERFWARFEPARDGDPLKQYRFAKYLESPEGPWTVERSWTFPHGLGIDKTELDASYWYRKAAEQGHAGAQYELGGAYLEGRGREEGADVAKAVCWYRKAAEQGHAEARYELGRGYREGWGVGEDADVAQAECWYRKAAEQGHVEARYELGRGYREGWGVGEDADMAQAECWYRKAAEQGPVEARYELGRGILEGWGEERSADVAEAAKWLRRAAEQNHTQAQYELGCAYRDGRLGELGVEQRVARAEAEKWLRRAVEHGHPDARAALARMCSDGNAEENG